MLYANIKSIYASSCRNTMMLPACPSTIPTFSRSADLDKASARRGPSGARGLMEGSRPGVDR